MFRLKSNLVFRHFFTLLLPQFKQSESFVKSYVPFHGGSAN